MTNTRTIPAEEFDDQVDQVETEVPDINALAMLNKSEIDQQVSTAKHYPRSVAKFRKEAFGLITLDEETAAACIYALPRGKEWNPQTKQMEKKIIKGPSARFGEIIAYSWGNCRSGARVISEEGEFVTAQGMFYDLERNVAISYEVKRRITDKDGRRYSGDMIGVTANAACAIALRNAVLKGIPKALWKGLYTAAEKTIMGTIETLSDRREKMVSLFKPFGVTGEMLSATIGVNGVSEIGIEHLVELQGMLTALQEGDSTVEQMFKSDAQRTNEHVADVTAAKTAGLADKYVKKDPEQSTEPAADAVKEAMKAQEKLDKRRDKENAHGPKQPTSEDLGFSSKEEK